MKQGNGMTFRQSSLVSEIFKGCFTVYGLALKKKTVCDFRSSSHYF